MLFTLILSCLPVQFEIVRQRFITKQGVFSEAMFSQSEVAITVMHHSGAFTVMLPACMFLLFLSETYGKFKRHHVYARSIIIGIYYADNEYVQQIALGLLGAASFLMGFHIWNNTRDVYDLKVCPFRFVRGYELLNIVRVQQERGQFVVSYFLMFVCYVAIFFIPVGHGGRGAHGRECF